MSDKEGQIELFDINKNVDLIDEVKTLAPWKGGKYLLSKEIGRIIRSTEHQAYCEPFVGMGGVFFKKRQIVRCEVINDQNDEIINLFKVVRDRPEELKKQFKYALSSRSEFYRLKSLDFNSLKDVEKAARFLYLQRLRFGGSATSCVYGVDNLHGSRLNVDKLFSRIDSVYNRLKVVNIENLDFEGFISRYDGKHVLFYCDPPYYKCSGYKIKFKEEDHTRLNKCLSNIRGKFILSINDHEYIRELFNKHYIKEVSTSYSIRGKRIKGNELIISNYKI